MKFFRNTAFVCFFALSLLSCKKDNDKDWKIEVKSPAEKVSITDISKELYDPNVSAEAFKQKYPWFQGTTISDEEFAKRRVDPLEVKIYKEAISKVKIAQVEKDLGDLFEHIKHYFPKFQTPKVYVFSSAMQSSQDPIIYNDEQKLLFIDFSSFMGADNMMYQGMEKYLLKSMNPENIVPKVSRMFAENIAPYSTENMKFIDELVYEGKIMTLQDAFLPNTPDYLKMNYTKEQLDWALANEDSIWNYFVENNLVFSDDSRLVDRFITIGPFSKFYTEIDAKSSPQIGIFTGWRIARSFFKNKPETTLANFMQMKGQDIFNASQYKPKVSE